MLLNLPPPVSQHAYQQHMKSVAMAACNQIQDCMHEARAEIRNHYDAAPVQVVNILVSCDGTWQKRGFSSLFGAVFVIAYETGKVVDFAFLSRHCSGYKKWDGRDKTTTAFCALKQQHVCSINFTGSTGSMEPRRLHQSFGGSDGISSRLDCQRDPQW